MRNEHPGICYRCGEVVLAGKGHFEKVTSLHPEYRSAKWRTQHAHCAIKYRGTFRHRLGDDKAEAAYVYGKAQLKKWKERKKLEHQGARA